MFVGAAFRRPDSGAMLLLALVASGCGRSAEVQIHNHSATRLLDLFVSGGGDRVKVDFVEPMGRRRTLLCPQGEAGSIEISFTAGTKTYQTTQQAYFECSGSYQIQIDISPEFEARSAVRLR
jgi:hypothetical protein